MTKYESKNATAPARRKRKIRNVAMGIVAFVLVLGTPAIAAMMIESNEATARVDAGVAVPLELGDAKAVGDAKLFPGTSVDMAFAVRNPNPFPVTVKTVTANASRLSVSCAVAGDERYLSAGFAVSGSTITLPTAVVVAPGQRETVTLVKAVRLKADASGGCTLSAGFKVTGTGAGPGE